MNTLKPTHTGAVPTSLPDPSSGLRSPFLGFLVLLLLLGVPGYAEITVPKLTGWVNDYADILSQAAEAQLERELKAHEDSTTNQIVVLTVPSLEGEVLEEVANQVFNAWGLGQRGKDNGVLLLVSVDDRKLRIEVGNGLEGVLTDAHCGRIIRNEITPSFKRKAYEAGIADGVAAIRGAIYGTYSAQDPTYWEQLFLYEGLPFPDNLLIGVFMMGMLLVFTFMVIFSQGFVSVFFFLFILFFYLSFPFAIFGSFIGFIILGAYVGGYLWTRYWFRTKPGIAWLEKKSFGPVSRLGSRTAYASSGRRSSYSSSRSSFSGGGGSSSGGGSSGSW
jgi:uncharacterized protein